MLGELISIIIPVYKNEETILRCLNSVINQTYKNIEIIVVYYESSDKTLEIIQGIKDNRIKIINQDKKSGPGGARNIGLEHALGKYAGFVEADDEILPDYYEKLYSALVSNDCDAAMGKTCCVKGFEECSRKSKNKVLEKFSDKMKFLRNGASFDKLYKLSIIKENGIKFLEYYRFEDNPFNVEYIFFCGKMVYESDAVYKYYLNSEKETAEYRRVLSDSLIPTTDKIFHFIRARNISGKNAVVIYDFLLRSYIDYFIFNRDIYEFIKNGIENKFYFYRKIIWYKLKLLKRKLLKKDKEI